MMTLPSPVWLEESGVSEMNNLMLAKEDGLVVMMLLKITETDTIRLTIRAHLLELAKKLEVNGPPPLNSLTDKFPLKMFNRLRVLEVLPSNLSLSNNNRTALQIVQVLQVPNYLQDSEKEWLKEVLEVSLVLRESSRLWMTTTVVSLTEMSSTRL
jgi:hypothetical protein